MPCSPFELGDPLPTPAENAARIPPTIATSPFDMPPVANPGVVNDEDDNLPIGSASIMPLKVCQEPHIPSPIARSPFDIPDIYDAGFPTPGHDEKIMQSDLNVENTQPRHFMPAELPRSPFGYPIDENG